MKKIDLNAFLMGKEPEITDEVIDYYRKHPKELDMIVDKETFHVRFLSFFFVLGLGTTIIARVLKFFFKGTWGDFFNEVILDMASELGIAVFGGAVTAYLLEYLSKKQYEQNMRFREQVMTRLEER